MGFLQRLEDNKDEIEENRATNKAIKESGNNVIDARDIFRYNGLKESKEVDFLGVTNIFKKRELEILDDCDKCGKS